MRTLILHLLPVLASLTISTVFTLSIIDLAKKKSLFEANNSLKLHLEQVCSLGGISIFAAFWISASLFGGGLSMGPTAYLFAGSFLLFLTGVKDDLVGIPPLQRLFIQIGVASLLFFGGIQLTHLPGLEGELPWYLSYVFTILLIGGIVNAFNFIDGINGLSGGLAVISALCFALLFYYCGATVFAGQALAMAGAVLGFLFFNFGKAKIFMGDNGSTFVGIMLSAFTIIFLRPEVRGEVDGVVSPAIVLAILFVPLADLVKVVAGRLVRRKSPFHGDLTHVHHMFASAGFTANQTCFALFGWSMVVSLLAFSFFPQNIFVAVSILALLAGGPYFFINLAGRTRKEKKPTPFHASKASDYF